MKNTWKEIKIGETRIAWYHNTKTHRYDIVVDYYTTNPFIISKAKGEAIFEFLKFLTDLQQWDAGHFSAETIEKAAFGLSSGGSTPTKIDEEQD